MSINFTEQITLAALQAPSADNIQPFHFTWDGARLTVSYDADRLSDVTFAPDDPATLLSVGGVMENLLQVANSYGLSPDIQLLPGPENGTTEYLRMNLELGRELLDFAERLPLFNRHTNRFPFKNNQLPDGLISDIATEVEGEASARIIQDVKLISKISKLVRRASEMRFQTKEVHEWLGKSLRFSQSEVARGDGLDVATLDLPPGGKWFLKLISEWRRMAFLNHFGIYKLLATIDAKPVGKATALVAIIGKPGRRATIDAGRLLTRVWTRLNAEGVAVHPYYVIPDQLQRLSQGLIPDKLSSQAQYLQQRSILTFGLNEETDRLRMLLRVGYPTKQPPRSKRLPLNRVFSEKK